MMFLNLKPCFFGSDPSKFACFQNPKWWILTTLSFLWSIVWRDVLESEFQILNFAIEIYLMCAEIQRNSWSRLWNLFFRFLRWDYHFFWSVYMWAGEPIWNTHVQKVEKKTHSKSKTHFFLYFCTEQIYFYNYIPILVFQLSNMSSHYLPQKRQHNWQLFIQNLKSAYNPGSESRIFLFSYPLCRVVTSLVLVGK